jgi:hypothetical protein
MASEYGDGSRASMRMNLRRRRLFCLIALTTMCTAPAIGTSGVAGAASGGFQSSTSTSSPVTDEKTLSALTDIAQTDATDLQSAQATLSSQLSQTKSEIDVAEAAIKAHKDNPTLTDMLKVQTDLNRLETSVTVFSTTTSTLERPLADLISPPLVVIVSNVKRVADGILRNTSRLQSNSGKIRAALDGAVTSSKEALQVLHVPARGTSVNPSTMFNLQFHMQVMSQYLESASNTLSSIHNEMITLAHATKGQ